MGTNVHLTPELERFAREVVAEGRYNNVSEVVRDGLRLLQDAAERKKNFMSDAQRGRGRRRAERLDLGRGCAGRDRSRSSMKLERAQAKGLGPSHSRAGADCRPPRRADLAEAARWISSDQPRAARRLAPSRLDHLAAPSRRPPAQSGSRRPELADDPLPVRRGPGLSLRRASTIASREPAAHHAHRCTARGTCREVLRDLQSATDRRSQIRLRRAGPAGFPGGKRPARDAALRRSA